MNDLGWTLGWLAVQVAVVLVPAFGLHAMASRRDPASGAWVATLGLGMVVVLGVLAFLPIPGGGPIRPGTATSTPPTAQPGVSPRGMTAVGARTVDRADGPTSRGLGFSEIRLAWTRLGRRAAEPAARFRPWGRIISWASLAGSGVGLLRLAIGLWAVGLCRRRGESIDDRPLIGLVDELRRAMGCRRAVEIREVPDLATPATAGWFRPMLLLPANWRDWDDAERRAVVAHELAHVIRGDYASGLLARVAVVLHYYHPLVRGMAGRLQLEQELAADAMGARFAGGRSSYLLALSRLALMQEARPSSWPARAFLPSRGTLIRRIAMLKNETEPRIVGRTRSGTGRLAMALGLLALTIGVAMLKAPAHAQAGEERPTPRPSTPSVARAAEGREAAQPFPVEYISEDMVGVVAFRPAAFSRLLNMGPIKSLVIKLLIGDENPAKNFKDRFGIDTAAPGWRKLEVEDFESFVSGMTIGNSKDPKTQKDLHTLIFGAFTARMVAPFDWLKYLRQWKFESDELHEGTHVFHRLKGPLQPYLGKSPCFYAFDDRTIVFDEESRIRKFLARPAPLAPAFLRGPDWERANPGVFAYAIDNHDGALAKRYDLARPDDAVFLSLFRGVERWVIGVADQDPISLHAELTAIDPPSAGAVARSVEEYKKLGLAGIAALPQADVESNRALKMARGLLTNLAVRQDGPGLGLSTAGINTVADLAGLFKDLAERSIMPGSRAPKAEEAKAATKAEKR